MTGGEAEVGLPCRHRCAECGLSLAELVIAALAQMTTDINRVSRFVGDVDRAVSRYNSDPPGAA